MKITWYVDDGYVYKDRPLYIEIPDDEVAECDDEIELSRLVEDYITNEFENNISPCWDGALVEEAGMELISARKETQQAEEKQQILESKRILDSGAIIQQASLTNLQEGSTYYLELRGTKELYPESPPDGLLMKVKEFRTDNALDGTLFLSFRVEGSYAGFIEQVTFMGNNHGPSWTLFELVEE
jgi:hypothetical protein